MQSLEGTELDDPWLRVEEAAELLKVSTRTIYRMVNDRSLPATRIGNLWRIRRADVLNLGQERAS